MTSWRDLIKVHPAADAFPMMPPGELDNLAENIRKNGLQNPIATWFDKDEQEWLIDGRNRLDALERLGYKFSLVSHSAGGVCTTSKLKIRNPNARAQAGGHDCTALDNEWISVHQFRETHTCGTFGWPIADPYDLARLYNLDRRHLSKDDYKEAAAKLLKANPERSDRSIAKDTGLDHKTVAAERKKGEASGEIPHIEPTERTDAGGRKRARKTPATKPATTDFDPRGSSPTTPAAPTAAEEFDLEECTRLAAMSKDEFEQHIVEVRAAVTAEAPAGPRLAPLTILKMAWEEAAAEEQQEFVEWLWKKSPEDAREEFLKRVGAIEILKRDLKAELDRLVQDNRSLKKRLDNMTPRKGGGYQKPPQYTDLSFLKRAAATPKAEPTAPAADATEPAAVVEPTPQAAAMPPQDPPMAEWGAGVVWSLGIKCSGWSSGCGRSQSSGRNGFVSASISPRTQSIISRATWLGQTHATG